MSWLTKLRQSKKIQRDAAIAKNKGRAEGYEMGVSQHIDNLSKLQGRVDTMTGDFVSLEKKLRETYIKRLESIEQDHKTKCEVCKKGVEAEKDKLIQLQQDLSQRISAFQQLERKMFTFISLVEDSFETILRHSGRMTDALNQLHFISSDVNKFLEESKDLLELQP